MRVSRCDSEHLRNLNYQVTWQDLAMLFSVGLINVAFSLCKFAISNTCLSLGIGPIAAQKGAVILQLRSVQDQLRQVSKVENTVQPSQSKVAI